MPNFHSIASIYIVSINDRWSVFLLSKGLLIHLFEEHIPAPIFNLKQTVKLVKRNVFTRRFIVNWQPFILRKHAEIRTVNRVGTRKNRVANCSIPYCEEGVAPSVPPFPPVPLRWRRDGGTTVRQRRVITFLMEELACCWRLNWKNCHGRENHEYNSFPWWLIYCLGYFQTAGERVHCNIDSQNGAVFRKRLFQCVFCSSSIITSSSI